MDSVGRHIWNTSISEWPDSVFDLCLPFQQIDISKNDLDALIVLSGGIISGQDRSDTLGLSDDFISDFDAVLSAHPAGAHIRFDLCSLKLGSTSPRIFTTSAFLASVSRGRERISSTLSSAAIEKKDAHLFIFPWHNIPPWSEFRLFIRDRKVVGVSQYHHQKAYPEIQENLEAIKASLIPFSRRLIDALHMDTVVADVFVEQQADDSFKTTLIELNPFIQRTNPCLYSWQNGGDFDGDIRYRKLRYNPYA